MPCRSPRRREHERSILWLGASAPPEPSRLIKETRPWRGHHGKREWVLAVDLHWARAFCSPAPGHSHSRTRRIGKAIRCFWPRTCGITVLAERRAGHEIRTTLYVAVEAPCEGILMRCRRAHRRTGERSGFPSPCDPTPDPAGPVRPRDGWHDPAAVAAETGLTCCYPNDILSSARFARGRVPEGLGHRLPLVSP